jgi:hypothetical protein
MRALARGACIVGAIAALGLTIQASWDLYLTGFPDGHLTDYDKAVNAPKRVLMWVEFAFAPVFLLLAFSRIGERARAIGFVAALTALVVVGVVQLVGLPWYFITHLGLDNGIGG